MLVVLSFDGANVADAKMRTLALGGRVLRASQAASGETVHVEARLDRTAMDRAALAEFSGELKLSAIRVLERAVG
jgi:hypothetical protein